MELQFDRLSKEYGAKIAVDRVSAALGPGVYGLLGANGAGKTTLMRMACGVLSPTSGEVLFDGVPIERAGGAYRAALGYLPQDFGYYPEFTALDFMEYMAALKGIGRRAARERSLELLDAVGLAGEERRRIRTFSGGEKALIAISVLFAILKARTMPLCVFDEVEAALDQANVERFARYLNHFRGESQFIVVTHRPGTMEQCDTLYGVTMQQNGVSTLLKVQLQDAMEIVDKEKEEVKA